MRSSLVIYGAGPFARLMRYHFESNGQPVAAFAMDRQFLTGATFEQRPVVPFDEVTARYPPERHGMFVAIGYRRMRDRAALFARARAAGYALHSFVSPHAVVHPNAETGSNNVFLDGVLVEPFAAVADNCIFTSGTLVSHGSRVGADCFFAARCVIGGNTVVGTACFFGNGALTIDGLRIGSETHLLPGTVVFQDTQPHTRYGGNPARALGTHADSGIEIARG